MQAQVSSAIDERLRDLGASALGGLMVIHANEQKSRWALPFYNSYYAVLSAYLEEINYGGSQGISRESAGRGSEGAASSAPTETPMASPSVTASPRSLKVRLGELKELLDESLITQDEHDIRRREILAEV